MYADVLPWTVVAYSRYTGFPLRVEDGYWRLRSADCDGAVPQDAVCKTYLVRVAHIAINQWRLFTHSDIRSGWSALRGRVSGGVSSPASPCISWSHGLLWFDGLFGFIGRLVGFMISWSPAMLGFFVVSGSLGLVSMSWSHGLWFDGLFSLIAVFWSSLVS